MGSQEGAAGSKNTRDEWSVDGKGQEPALREVRKTQRWEGPLGFVRAGGQLEGPALSMGLC